MGTVQPRAVLEIHFGKVQSNTALVDEINVTVTGVLKDPNSDPKRTISA